MTKTGKKYPKRGFGSMSPEQRSAIASLGGRAAHQKGVAHEWTVDEARAAGRKGGRPPNAPKAATEDANLVQE